MQQPGNAPLFPRGKIEFRPISDADTTDRDFLRALYASTRDWERQQTIWSDADWADFIAGQFDAQDRHYKMTYLGAAFRIIQLDGVDIGRLYVDRQDDCLRIIEFTLAPAYRGRGIGTDILRALMNEAYGGKVPVRLSVEKNNPALSLYLRHGFQVTGDLRSRVDMAWHPETGPREV